MSKIDNYIKKRSENNKDFEKLLSTEDEKLRVAAKLTELRISCGLTQQQLAKKIGKPQSTISRIETGEMNPTIGLVIEIVNGMGKQFVPLFK